MLRYLTPPIYILHQCLLLIYSAVTDNNVYAHMKTLNHAPIPQPPLKFWLGNTRMTRLALG